MNYPSDNFSESPPPFDVDAHPAGWPVDALLAQCDVRRQKRSGPGGQHRNKVETAVVIVHRPTGTRGEASERRSQAENLKMAVHRLRTRLALVVRQPLDDPKQYTPSRLWAARLHGRQLSVSPTHDDLPTLLAEAFDLLDAFAWDFTAAAERLGCTSSQLVKLLKVEPAALVLANQRRLASGRRPLQ